MTFLQTAQRAYHRVRRKKFVKDYRTTKVPAQGRALVYYKTDPIVFASVGRNQAHVNNWEVGEIARIFNRLGFTVDMIDRSARPDDIMIDDTYDVFLGIGAGDSGRHYADFAAKVPSAIKIFYALGPEPRTSNAWTLARYDYFRSRHPEADVEVRRTIKHVDIEKAMDLTDAIFCCGNETTMETYRQFAKPMYAMLPSTPQGLSWSPLALPQKDQKTFLYFGGNGHIVKGLDLVIEAFATLPECTLAICGPGSEKDFNAIYAPYYEKYPNITWHGFVDTAGETFADLSARAGYVIFPSASEGAATSVVTCLRRGLIPIVTRETGIDVDDFGYLVPDVRVEVLAAQVRSIVATPREEWQRRMVAAYDASFTYTQARFSERLERALVDLLFHKKHY